MTLIKAENLVLGYEGRAIVNNLNFSVEIGDYLCIVGENGSGKSTLIKALLGIKTPLEGKIIFGDGLAKNQIGYLPQQNGAQKDFPALVSEVVISGCLNSKKFFCFYSKEQKARAAENMRRLEITDIAKKSFRELSGGQQQRVLLARALCATQKIILLDEPVSGLDPKVTQELYDLISEINKSGVTVIMVSHDINSALKYSNKILHISHDNSFFGSTEEYVNGGMAQIFAKRGDANA